MIQFSVFIKNHTKIHRRRATARSKRHCGHSSIADKMLILLLMMMIVKIGSSKRARKDPQQISVLSTNESEGELDPKLCMLCRRKRPSQSNDLTGGSNSRKNTQLASKTTKRPLRHNTDSFPNSDTILVTRALQTKKVTQRSPSPIELYHKLHFHPIKKWLNDESHIQYENIVKMKEGECQKLVLAGTSMTQELEYDIEKKVVKVVCAKHKTLLSGWEASSGPIMRKKDIPILSAMETSQSASKDEGDMKSQINALEEKLQENKEKLKEGEEKYEKLLQFVISKFPHSHDIFGTRAKDGAFMHNDMTYLSDQE